MTTRKKPRTTVRATTKALSETEVHYLVGFLYVVTRRDDLVVLGEKVRDTTTNTDRDVDIVVSGGRSLLGVEVKDKGRPLDVGIVEGICMKYIDMPALNERAIVSSSGYTEPARRKALSHNVKCLCLLRGTLPSAFAGTDLSALTHLTHRLAVWSRLPSVIVELVDGVLCPLPLAAKLRTLEEPLGARRTLGSLVAAMPNKIAGKAGPVEANMAIEYPLDIEIGSTYRRVASIRASGFLSISESRTPLKTMCYLENDQREAEASVVLFDYADGLVGVATGQDHRVSIVRIPEALRKKRPIKHSVGRA